ncbi:MAG: hypothetical protein LC790_07695, partial [Actinobacteria bacterium]|nr:hypothetical protein [Actinomycetota bacterium]
ELVVEEPFARAFPAKRLSEVVVELDDGRRLRSGALQAPGEPDDPGWFELVATKVARHAPWLEDTEAAQGHGLEVPMAQINRLLAVEML